MALSPDENLTFHLTVTFLGPVPVLQDDRKSFCYKGLQNRAPVDLAYSRADHPRSLRPAFAPLGASLRLAIDSRSHESRESMCGARFKSTQPDRLKKGPLGESQAVLCAIGLSGFEPPISWSRT
jgi:hypothetical protein